MNRFVLHKVFQSLKENLKKFFLWLLYISVVCIFYIQICSINVSKSEIFRHFKYDFHVSTVNITNLYPSKVDLCVLQVTAQVKYKRHSRATHLELQGQGLLCIWLGQNGVLLNNTSAMKLVRINPASHFLLASSVISTFILKSIETHT